MLAYDDNYVRTDGGFPKIARLKAEFYEWVEDPGLFLKNMRIYGPRADIFTFLDKTGDETIRFDFYYEWEHIAVLRISSFEEWWKKQINDKTRNMVRKAQKAGVEIHTVPFSDELLAGIQKIYDESPVRQGKPFTHYGKDLKTLAVDHASYLEKSQFIGAFYKGELIGFVKLVHNEGISNLMQIIALIAHRDKAPTNALISRAVELCAEKGVPLLQYGVWSRQGLGDFKRHHAFERMRLPRYFVPLTWRGEIILKLRLHRKWASYLPDPWFNRITELRRKWYPKIHGLWEKFVQ